LVVFILVLLKACLILATLPTYDLAPFSIWAWLF
jgi:hypothetical protein